MLNLLHNDIWLQFFLNEKKKQNKKTLLFPIRIGLFSKACCIIIQNNDLEDFLC